MNLTTTSAEPIRSHSAVSISILHDFRNPMATIRAASELLVQASSSDPHIYRIARNVQLASARMQELLDNFFDRYAGVRRDPRPTDVPDLVATAVDWIRERAEGQAVQILQELPAGMTLCVDRQRIERVLVNVFCNALEVMPDGGAIEISAVSEPSAILIQVRDTGPGIAAEVRGQLFEPFVTGKPGGAGLGLASSRQAVIDHGGEIWAESSGRGAVFSLRLPRIQIPRPTPC